MAKRVVEFPAQITGGTAAMVSVGTGFTEIVIAVTVLEQLPVVPVTLYVVVIVGHTAAVEVKTPCAHW